MLFRSELAPPALGLARLRDPETGRAVHVDWRSAAARGAYAAAVEAWRARSAAALDRAGVDLMDVPLPLAPDRDAIVRPILQFFRMRVRRRAKR